MWTSKGRSGYGDSTLQGDYDDWQGLSRNGRQWKNESTHLVRDLQGSDYWHLRKQIRPTEEIPQSMHAVNDTANLSHCLPNGRANLAAYADNVQPIKKNAKSRSIREKVLPQEVRLQNLEQMMKELDIERKTTNMPDEEYYQLHAVLKAKHARTFQLLSKQLGWNDEQSTDSLYKSNETPTLCGKNGVKNDVSCQAIPLWLLDLNEANWVRNVGIKALLTGRMLVRCYKKTAAYINELKEV